MNDGANFRVGEDHGRKWEVENKKFVFSIKQQMPIRFFCEDVELAVEYTSLEFRVRSGDGNLEILTFGW